jgi:hypothetical protein
MSDTFGMIPFTILASNMGRKRSSEVTYQHIPGGTITYADSSGPTQTEIPYSLMSSEADYMLLESMVGGTAQLVSSIDGTIPYAMMEDINRTQRVPVTGVAFADVKFVIVTPG